MALDRLLPELSPVTEIPVAEILYTSVISMKLCHITVAVSIPS